MESRRSFLKKASLLAGSTALFNSMPQSIARALAISADPGTTYLNAENIVFLMQENRSFDHCFGRLRGVRGFNDPRAIDTPTGLPVWYQRNNAGKTATPFRLDIKNTKSTWMGSLPHGWEDMVAARNNGKMDKWLEAKKSGNPDYAKMPLTMGYYDREDLPFYYSFADAFTVCDQSFCSTLTGTSPNRNYFWAGTVREDAHNPSSKAHVDNGMIDFKNVSWKTYPERLEEAGISWGVYQNELSIPTGLSGEEEFWLANFTDNDLEFIKQYNVRFHPQHRAWMQSELEKLLKIEKSEKHSENEQKELTAKIANLRKDLEVYSEANFNKLSDHQKAIHNKAFITNKNYLEYRKLESLKFEEKELKVPKGDVLHQFRNDVDNGELPMVSWLVAPCAFSDHPGSPWYGAWYVSEVLDILTKNPEQWKKTIFIVTYDENDGYFDHVPPFVAPKPGSGATNNIPTEEEFVDGKHNLGLGFRVPMIVASPWSRGGYVNSEVFDHTSSLQFLEHFIEKKTGKKVIEENIGDWRRAICGNLTSVFRDADSSVPKEMTVKRDAYIQQIYNAKEKKLPSDYKMLIDTDLRDLRNKDQLNKLLPAQEPGTKPACALPYNLSLDCGYMASKDKLELTMSYQNTLSKSKKGAAPFQVYDMTSLLQDGKRSCYDFTVSEGEHIKYDFPFHSDKFFIKAYAPNGFYREFRGHKNQLAATTITLKTAGNKEGMRTVFQIDTKQKISVAIIDKSYNRKPVNVVLEKGTHQQEIDVRDSFGWYDYSILIAEYPEFEQRFAGHIENGKTSTTDPLMGRSV